MNRFAKKMWRRCVAIVLLIIAGIPSILAIESKPEELVLAIAYTETNYEGVAWPVFQEGRYDLYRNFNLPNDTIASIRIAPGWSVTLYEHAKFEGDWVTLTEDAADLDLWKDSASSLTVTKIEGETAPYSGKPFDEYLVEAMRYRGPYPEAEILTKIEALSADEREKIRDFQEQGEFEWYGRTTDNERIARAGELLELFGALGVKTLFWKNSAFAQRLNNFYDWNKSWSVWKTACMAINVENTEEE
jgi:hypothetical protein